MIQLEDLVLVVIKINYFSYYLFLDFGKGLFDEKHDFEPSDDMDDFKIIKKNAFDTELKEIEIKNAMFDTVREDLFFSIDGDGPKETW